MGYIIFAHICIGMFDSAVAHLRLKGHHIEVTDDIGNVLGLFKAELPDVLVIGSHLKYKEPLPKDIPEDPDPYLALEYGRGLGVISTLRRIYHNMPTTIIFIAIPHNETGEPIYNWDQKDISTFLPFPSSEWEIILAVEQALYRKITVKANPS